MRILRLLTTSTAFVLTLTGAAIAEGKGPKKAVGVGVGGCPPGLAKKSPKCIPPGQVQKGDRIDDRYERLEDLWRYRLDGDGDFYRLGDNAYRVDPNTQEILEVLGVLADLAGN